MPIFRCLLMIIMTCSSLLTATDYYVDGKNRGGGKNDGSQANPWASLADVNKNLSKLVAGDTVKLASDQSFTGPLIQKEVITSGLKGTASKPITFTTTGSGKATIVVSGNQSGAYLWSYDGASFSHLTFRNLTLVGPWSLATPVSISAPGIVAYCNGVTKGLTIDNVDISGFSKGIEVSVWDKGSYDGVRVINSRAHHNLLGGIAFYGPRLTNVVIRRSQADNNPGDPKLKKKSGNGIVLGGVTDGLIEYCSAFENGAGCGVTDRGPVGIWCYESKNILFQFNEAYRNHSAPNGRDGDGFDIDVHNQNCIMQYNYAHDNDGAGFLMCNGDDKDWATGKLKVAPWSGNVLRYNISENDGRKLTGYGGIRVFNSGSDFRGGEIYHNTIYLSNPVADSTGISMYAWPAEAGITGMKIRNNLVVTTGGVPVISVSGKLKDVVIDGNNYWSSGAAFSAKWQGKSYASLAEWKKISLLDTNSFNVDPLLIKPGGGGTIGNPDKLATLTAYQLQAGSPMIDKALSLGTTSPGERDFFGIKIPQGPRNDIGASERVTTTTQWAVTYYGNNPTAGAAPVDSKTYASGATVTVLGNSGNLSKTGYRFAGWNVNSSGSGANYAVGSTFTIGSANVSLYAKWTPLAYVVSYDPNSATSGTVPANQTKTYNVSLTLASNQQGALARTGYTFGGWNTSADGSGTAFAEGASYTANAAIKLYAKWAATTYAITYDANGATAGTVPASQIKTTGGWVTIADNTGDLTKTDATFAGWNTKADGNGSNFAPGGTYSTNANVTMYAKWSAPALAKTTWTSQDIGAATPVGSFSSTGDGLTLSGGGKDIWNADDSFRFAWQTVSGDWDATARVVSQTNTNVWAKAGLMVRESRATNSRYAFCLVTPGSGSALQFRTATGENSGHVSGPQVTAPTWLKLSRRGTSFSALQSSDGKTWVTITMQAIDLPASALVGIAVTSHKDGTLSTVEFSGWTITPISRN